MTFVYSRPKLQYLTKVIDKSLPTTTTCLSYLPLYSFISGGWIWSPYGLMWIPKSTTNNLVYDRISINENGVECSNKKKLFFWKGLDPYIVCKVMVFLWFQIVLQIPFFFSFCPKYPSNIGLLGNGSWK